MYQMDLNEKWKLSTQNNAYFLNRIDTPAWDSKKPRTNRTQLVAS